MKMSTVIVGFAAAALAGAAIGMLLAPEKGSDLQKKLKDEANKWIDEVKRLVTTAQETADEADEELTKIKSNLKPIIEN